MRCRSNITFLMFLLFQLCGVVLKLVSNCYRPRSIILASCKPGCKPAFRLAWTCQKHVASRSKACRKPARTCRKPGCKPGRKPGLHPGLELARIMECGLKLYASASLDCTAGSILFSTWPSVLPSVRLSPVLWTRCFENARKHGRVVD